MKAKVLFTYLSISLLLSCVSNQQSKWGEKEKQVVFRQIGSRLLSAGKDTTSRILPIEKPNANKYVISFSKPLAIISDSLHRIVAEELNRIGEVDFIVELKDCETGRVQQSFLYFSATDSITPCDGRELPPNCYNIELTLSKNNSRLNSIFYVLIPVSLLLVALLVFRFFKKPRKQEEKKDNAPSIVYLGRYGYNANERLLLYEDTSITLTDKESQLLTVLASQVNQVCSREYLMSELWGRQGLVVVQKNLDVLVSKLRKKLVLDETIKIINVHSAGYKLQII